MNQPHAPEQHASCNLQESNGRRPHNIAAVAALYCAIGDYALFALSALMMYTLEQMPYHPANVLMLIASGLLFLAALPVAGFTVILAVLGLVQCMRHTEQCRASENSTTPSCHRRGMVFHYSPARSRDELAELATWNAYSPSRASAR